MATACLKALRQHYPDAHITWAVGGWSKQVVENHPYVDDILDTGHAALPVKSPRGFSRFVAQLRAGYFDLAVSLVRSPLMSLAVLLSGIPKRAGLDSNGRGFGYNLRARINPQRPENEAIIYLRVAELLGAETIGCYTNVPVTSESSQFIQQELSQPYVVINPSGGSNPGMLMDSKRYPPEKFAKLADLLSETYNVQLILLGGPADGQIIQAVEEELRHPAKKFVGELSFVQITALATNALIYIGNDTGLTHYAAAAGAKTAMILGPSDPARYAPYTEPNQSIALWKPVDLAQEGVVAHAKHTEWDWDRDGIDVEDAFAQIQGFLRGGQ